MRKWLPILLALLAAGCVDRSRVPVMGLWTGGFYADKGQAFKGYLQLYRTGDKFKMRLASKDQAIDFDGTWTVDKRRIVLSVGDIKFDNPTEEDQKALGLKIIQPDEVRSAYSKPITLDLDQGETKLGGLTMTLGGLSGKHEFSKGEAARNSQKVLDDLRKNP